jgi:hypothetical protein
LLWGRRACGVGPPWRRQREKRYCGPKLKNRGGPACQPYALGVLNPFLYYQVLFNAYHLLPAQQTAPLTFSRAITLALLSVLLLGQRIGIKSFAALLISYTGVPVISTKGDVLGLVFVVGNLMQQFTDFTGRSGGVVRRPALVQLQGQDGRGGGHDPRAPGRVLAAMITRPPSRREPPATVWPAITIAVVA